jgi:hypothetical protein
LSPRLSSGGQLFDGASYVCIWHIATNVTAT